MYSIFSMSRMLKDKIVNTLYHKKFQNERVERMDPVDTTLVGNLIKLCREPTLVMDRVYLGNAYNASNFSCLTENNVGLIINITFEIPNYFEKHFQYHAIRIDDVNGASILPYFDTVNALIDNFLRQNTEQNVLIHCFMGSSRSASLAAVYYAFKNHCSVEEAIRYMKTKRDIVNINTSFIAEMRAWKLAQPGSKQKKNWFKQIQKNIVLIVESDISENFFV